MIVAQDIGELVMEDAIEYSLNGIAHECGAVDFDVMGVVVLQSVLGLGECHH